MVHQAPRVNTSPGIGSLQECSCIAALAASNIEHAKLKLRTCSGVLEREQHALHVKMLCSKAEESRWGRRRRVAG